MKRILIIDGQGGGMGAQLAKLLLPKLPADCELLAVGTNVLATSAMLKAGAVRGATGENAVVYNAARADVILGPIGILMANGIMGEVSPNMSVAISGSEAAKVLIPASGCGIFVAGTQDCRLDEYLQNAVALTLRALDVCRRWQQPPPRSCRPHSWPQKTALRCWLLTGAAAAESLHWHSFWRGSWAAG